jgi:hypothetical protein
MKAEAGSGYFCCTRHPPVAGISTVGLFECGRDREEVLARALENTEDIKCTLDNLSGPGASRLYATDFCS